MHVLTCAYNTRININKAQHANSSATVLKRSDELLITFSMNSDFKRTEPKRGLRRKCHGFFVNVAHIFSRELN